MSDTRSNPGSNQASASTNWHLRHTLFTFDCFYLLGTGSLNILISIYHEYQYIMLFISFLMLAISIYYISRICAKHYSTLYITLYRTPKSEESKNLLAQYVKNNVTDRVKELFIWCGIGFVGSLGIKLLFTQLYQLGLFTISLCTYHFLEYAFCCLYHFEKLHYDNFLINQSTSYTIAMTTAFIEYFIEFYFLNEYKQMTICKWITVVGIIGTIIGHIFRAGAEFTAQNNFTHMIRYSK